MRALIILLLCFAAAARAFLWPDCIDVWRGCQQDRICRFLYREGKERAICRAIDYFRSIEARNKTPPIWPSSWLPAEPAHADRALVSTWNMASEEIPPQWALSLQRLKDYQLIHNEMRPCSGSMIAVYDAETDQMDCRCPPGAVCSTAEEAESSVWTAAIVLAAITLAIVLGGMIYAGVLFNNAMARLMP